MESIATSVLKATFGFLVKKCRDKVAERLKHGDVTAENFRAFIMRDIKNIESKLDGLARTNLETSINVFEEGIQPLYEVFERARSRSENGAVTSEEACTEAFSLSETIRKLDLTDLDESATVKFLIDAKGKFKFAREEATKAFSNKGLTTSDRILATQYRVMATILEKVDNPADALGTCRVCIEQLHRLPAIKECFKVELQKGLMSRFNKAERRKIISDVCHVNFLVYGVTIMVCTCFDNEKLSNWPCIGSCEEDKFEVDPLRDEKVSEILREQGMEHCYVTSWSFGQEGEEDHKLKYPRGIATTSSGQFIVGYSRDSKVKVFDSSGTFTNLLSFPNDDVLDVATDMNDNVYVLVKLEKPGAERDEGAVYKFNNTADLHHKFPVSWRAGHWGRLTVTDSGKVLLLRKPKKWVDVYETDGHLVSLLGKGILKDAYDITAANGGRVMVVESWRDYFVHIFSEHGDHLNKFKLQGRYSPYTFPQIAFHRASEHVVFVHLEKNLLHVEIYTKDGEFVRTTQIHEKWIAYSGGMAVTTEGRIAVVCPYRYNYTLTPSKVLVI